MRRHQPFPAFQCAVDAGKILQTFPEQFGKFPLHFADICNHAPHTFFVKVQRPRHVIENPDIVNDKPVSFPFVIRPVRAANSLQKRVVFHRLVQIHGLQNGRVKSGQEFGCHNHQFQGTLRVPENVKNPAFLIAVAAALLVAVAFVVVRVHDNSRRVRAEQFVKLRLVHETAFAVVYDDLSLVPVRPDFFVVMPCDMFADFANALRIVHDSPHIHAAGQFRAVLRGQSRFGGHGLKFLIQLLLADAEFHGNRLKMQGKRRAVADGIREGIAAHVAGTVLFRAERGERVAVRPVNRRTRQAEKERVRKRNPHFCAEIPFLRPVRLVRHDDNVASVVEFPVNLSEFENRGNQDFPRVGPEKRSQFLFAGSGGQIWNVGSVERGRNLRFQINPVVDNDHGRIFQFREHTELLRGENHQQRFS